MCDKPSGQRLSDEAERERPTLARAERDACHALLADMTGEVADTGVLKRVPLMRRADRKI